MHMTISYTSHTHTCNYLIG